MRAGGGGGGGGVEPGGGPDADPHQQCVQVLMWINLALGVALPLLLLRAMERRGRARYEASLRQRQMLLLRRRRRRGRGAKAEEEAEELLVAQQQQLPAALPRRRLLEAAELCLGLYASWLLAAVLALNLPW